MEVARCIITPEILSLMLSSLAKCGGEGLSIDRGYACKTSERATRQRLSVGLKRKACNIVRTSHFNKRTSPLLICKEVAIFAWQSCFCREYSLSA